MTTAKQRKKIYLEAANERFDEAFSDCGICYQLERYGLFAYSEQDIQFDVTRCGDDYKDLDRNCPEIKTLTLNNDGNYNYFEEDNEVRALSLLFAAELCNQ